jgi:uncharacterized membrane protein
LAILLYLPFYIGFSSQAGGILPNLEFPTRGATLWVMFGTLFLPLFATLIHLWRAKKLPANWKAGVGLSFGLVIFLGLLSLILAILAKIKLPDFVAGYLQSQGFSSVTGFLEAATLRRLYFIGGLLTLLSLLIPSIALLARPGHESTMEAGKRTGDFPASTSDLDPSRSSQQPEYFILFMILLGAVLVLAPEFVYLRDLFGRRMNTIFKFYYQAWIVWSLAAAFGSAVLLLELRRWWKWTWRICLAILLVVGLAFPVFGLPNKTNNFQIPTFLASLEIAHLSGDPTPLRTSASVWTFDGARLFHLQYPDDAAAADWLASAVPGVIVEAVSNRTYSDYSRMSVYSGLPAVLGWPGHEDQWRGDSEEQGSRKQDVERLYETNDWEEARSILDQYDIRYVVIGTLERSTYRVYELNFQVNLIPVFRSGNVIIYQVP